MNRKVLAAAVAGLCFTYGAANAAPEAAQESAAGAQSASPADIPEAVGATNDVVILELAPMQGGAPAGAEETAAMQMLLLQLLMMQSQGAGDGGETLMIAPTVPGGTGI
jgi:hypothetical protein